MLSTLTGQNASFGGYLEKNKKGPYPWELTGIYYVYSAIYNEMYASRSIYEILWG